MKKYLRYSIVFLVALLFLGACGKKEESSSEVMDQIDIANSLETDNFDEWYRSFGTIEHLSGEMPLFGTIDLGYNGQAIIVRDGKEMLHGRDRGGMMKGQITIKKYAGDTKVTTIDYELDKTYVVGKTYSKTTVLPEVEVSLSISQEEIDRIETDFKDQSYTFYGYKDPNGYLILTDGKEDKPTVYLYKLEQPMELKVTADKAAVRKEPLYDSEVITELSKDQRITASNSVAGERKDRGHIWYQIDVEGKTGFILQADIIDPKTNHYPINKIATRRPFKVPEILNGNLHLIADTWVNAAGEEITIKPDGSMSNGDRLQIGSETIDIPVLIVGRTEEGVLVYPANSPSDPHGGRSDSSKDRIAFSNKPIIPSDKFFYRKSDGVTTFDNTSSQNGTDKETSQSSSREPVVGNPSVRNPQKDEISLVAGSWSRTGSEPKNWIIHDSGLVNKYERIFLSKNQEGAVGKRFEIGRRATTPVLFIPAGTPHGASDSSKDRLFFEEFGKSNRAEDYYYRD